MHHARQFVLNADPDLQEDAVVDVRHDVRSLLLGVAQFPQRHRHGAIDDLQHAPAGEQLVFHERDVGFNARRVAIHHERNGARRRQHGDLGIAIAEAPAQLDRFVARYRQIAGVRRSPLTVRVIRTNLDERREIDGEIGILRADDDGEMARSLAGSVTD